MIKKKWRVRCITYSLFRCISKKYKNKFMGKNMREYLKKILRKMKNGI